MAKNDLFLFALAGIVVVGIIGIIVALKTVPTVMNPPVTGGNPPVTDGIQHFSSVEELQAYLADTNSGYYYGGEIMRSMSKGIALNDMAVAESAPSAAPLAPEYSQTNVQVENVDEPDIVKTDGNYIYTLSGNTLSVVKAYPVEEMKLVTSLDIKGTAQDIFINGDRLIVFAQEYERSAPEPLPRGDVAQKMMIMPPIYSEPLTQVLIYDVSDKADPTLDDTLEFRGNYFDARMIDNYVYLAVNQYARPDPIILPAVRINGVLEETPVTDIAYFPNPDSSYSFMHIAAIDVESGNYDDKVFVAGSSTNMYMSEDNLYLTYPKQIPYYKEQLDMFEEVLLPALPSDIQEDIRTAIKNIPERTKPQVIEAMLEDYVRTHKEEMDAIEKDLAEKADAYQKKQARERDQTIIQKISARDGKLEYLGDGSVPGMVLNQFSMDEKDSYFRIATTSGQVWASDPDTTSKNNIYVLDDDLKTIGKLEDLAPGERIYSARFMGNTAYMVTYRQVDPLFVIDLTDPNSPVLKGKLKIPGYSDYLHPYDETHLIGLGKDAIEVKDQQGGLYQGIKLALFDVSDLENPKEIDSFLIGDRGTESEALQDHKAFLFDKNKNLLAIPVMVAEIDEQNDDPYTRPGWQYGSPAFQGAYIFHIDESGFELRGKISHYSKEELLKMGSYWYSNSNVRRSLYIGDDLYTISDSKIKANSLDDLEESGQVSLPHDTVQEPPILY
ncbi:beta-propeller domain-containing protein [Candidatus Woesearchaeota archaeon]|nr:beta-propeller domain-containing protein [Candidatus Woesearchaeota archaeon]HIH37563.1 copper amine oxidase [Candidatus Woesearchaeota archaeon]HIH47976.1 copper amine oxidase [Candidatus Woesearchaeota archaeon]HIJ03696.1 copper amine oxidase [Candidatus Woesearchaeota archaeon]